MGLYINPIGGQAKEVWLVENALPIRGTPPWSTPNGMLLVCWVNNGYFTAAGVCTNRVEYEAFTDPDDRRPKRWFSAPIDKLEAVLGHKVSLEA